jgi:hypothetical protein
MAAAADADDPEHVRLSVYEGTGHAEVLELELRRAVWPARKPIYAGFVNQ